MLNIYRRYGAEVSKIDILIHCVLIHPPMRNKPQAGEIRAGLGRGQLNLIDTLKMAAD